MTKRKRITYIAGTQVELNVYTVPSIPKYKLRCGHKGGHSSAAQKRYNDKRQKEKLIQKAENTYLTGCWFVTYTYDDEHLPDCAKSVATNIRSAVSSTKDYYKNKKISCPYMGSVEIGYGGRLHGHMLYPYLSKFDKEIIKKNWTMGHVDIRYIPGINDYRRENVRGMDIKAVVQYIFKDPLVKIIGRKFKAPLQDVVEISDEEFTLLKNSPIEAEKELPGYRITSTENRDFSAWWGRYQQVKIRLAQQQNNSLFTYAEVHNYHVHTTISNELLRMVDVDQRQMWTNYGIWDSGR